MNQLPGMEDAAGAAEGSTVVVMSDGFEASVSDDMLADIQRDLAGLKQAPEPVRDTRTDEIRVALTDGQLIIACPWSEDGKPSKRYAESDGKRGMMKHVITGWRTVLLPDGRTISINVAAGVPAKPKI